MLRLVGVSSQHRAFSSGACRSAPFARVGCSPCLVDKRLCEHPQSHLLAQPVHRACQEAGTESEVTGFFGRDPYVHRVHWVGDVVKAQARDHAQNCRPSHLRIGERGDRKHAGVVVRRPEALGRFDDVMPRRCSRPRPPRAMGDRNQRAQCSRSVAARSDPPGDAHESLRGARLRPDVSSGHLAEPRKPSVVGCGHVQTLRLLNQTPDSLAKTKLIGELGCRDESSGLQLRISAEGCGPFERGGRHGHGTASRGSSRVRLEICREALVTDGGRHCPVPKATFGIVDDLR